jgi:hypothetical protein
MQGTAIAEASVELQRRKQRRSPWFILTQGLLAW